MTSAVLHKLPPFNNVVDGQTAILADIPQGMVYENILLELGTAFVAADIAALRLTLGGKKIWEISGTHLDTINQYRKLTNNVKYLPLWFANPNAFDHESYMAGAIDTSVRYSDFSLEVDIDGATGPTLAAHALRSSPADKNPQFRGMLRAMLRSAVSPGAANEFTYFPPVGGRDGSLISAVHWFHANITQLQVYKDSFPLLERALNADIQYLQEELYRSPQAGLLSWEPTFQNDERDAVPTVRGKDAQGNNILSNFEHRVTVSAADNLVFYSDLLTTQGNL